MTEKTETAGENENFVALIQAAIENSMMKKQILAIVQLDSFNRASLLGTYVTSLQLQGAPSELIEALNCLKEDVIAEKTREILLNENLAKSS
ncbi:MAG: hypothetical protein KKH97_03165 [Proteobacteria bacterium]|nr:hypothetical protein [Pseudomonadota bacterium]MBU1713820.1 hypothetical protein [Pseudomonadota bacterium]